MNIYPFSMSNTNNLSIQKRNNPSFKQSFIVDTPEMRDALKNKRTLWQVQNLHETLSKAGSDYFDSYITSNENGVIRYFLKFKENFCWPFNSGKGVYLTEDCDYSKGKFEIPENVTSQDKIDYCYEDETGSYHELTLLPDSTQEGEYGLYEPNTSGGCTSYDKVSAQEVVQLDRFLKKMAEGNIYGSNVNNYKLSYHPFPTEEQKIQDRKTNEELRSKALQTDPDEVSDLLGKYGKEM